MIKGKNIVTQIPSLAVCQKTSRIPICTSTHTRLLIFALRGMSQNARKLRTCTVPHLYEDIDHAIVFHAIDSYKGKSRNIEKKE